MENRRGRYLFAGLALVLLFAVLVVLNTGTGSVKIFARDALSAVLGENAGSAEHGIIWKVRLPRMAAAAILGGALALSGFLLQTFFNNPIAGPFVLGISSGAKLTVALAMIFVSGQNFSINSGILISAAFAGAMLSMCFVLLIVKRAARASRLLITGIMIGYICSAVTDFAVAFADDENIVNLHHWSQGSFSGTSWNDVRVMAFIVLAAAACAFLLSKPIGACRLGEAYAQSSGVNIKVLRVALVLTASILCACATAFAGPVSFVGVAVPHLVKAFAKTDGPLVVIPLCLIGGATFCLGCDLIARTVCAPAEMGISSVSSLFGAPVVIYIMTRKPERG